MDEYIERNDLEYIQKICACWDLQTPLARFVHESINRFKKGTEGSSA